MFFVRRERIWMIRSTSFSRPISGSNVPEVRQLRQVAAVLREERELLLLLVETSRSLRIEIVSSRTP